MADASTKTASAKKAAARPKTKAKARTRQGLAPGGRPTRRLGLSGEAAAIEVAPDRAERIADRASPAIALDLPDHPQVPDWAMTGLRRQALEQNLRLLKESETASRAFDRLRSDYREAVAGKVGAEAWTGLRADIDRARRQRLAAPAVDAAAVDKRRAAADARYGKHLRQAGLDVSDIRPLTRKFATRGRAAAKPLTAPGPEVMEISRNWNVPSSFDQDTRQVWDDFFYRRTIQDFGGARDFIRPTLEANTANNRLHVEHVWENTDLGDYDLFYFWGVSQLGEVLWLRAGESFSLEVTVHCIHSLHEINGADEWGFSDADSSGATQLRIDVGSERRQFALWAYQVGAVTHRRESPIAAGSVRRVTVDNIGPIPSDGFYIVWAGIRHGATTIQNDHSFNIWQRDRWRLDRIRVIQTPSQRP